MKFITESDLRVTYRKEPFSEFRLDKDIRLTPGARQFLTDRRIELLIHDVLEQSATVDDGQNEESGTVATPQETDWKTKKIKNEVTALVTSILLTAFELLEIDIKLSQKVAELEPHVSAMKNMLSSDDTPSSMLCEPCKSITQENFSDPLADCFAINAFHMQMPKVKAMLLINRIRCTVLSFEVSIVETYGENSKDALRRQINQIRNRLSQLICTAFGGNECQRKE
ncbi:hypothetical protein ACQ0P8_14390 [Halodesulfovibrio aestuarii]|uniref:Ethanolamine utilization cobalamin adenosyltransferase n=1 Tax=Halodesulfovibrio aestuarii TaxID=126333 RepID=A0A8G2CA09_9BACT|nr:hypothetical protein [Halodesulfovibrio aestuarii]SHJ24584.1 Ethanolamine utilization cobalamin adenosyltransferase [Halodesulfovibrio aestuarii]